MSLDRVPGADVLVTRHRGGLRLRTKVLLTLALLTLIVVLGRNAIATLAVRLSVRSIAGMSVEFRSLDMGLVNQRLRIRGLRVFNPTEFHREVLAEIPEVDVTYDFQALLQGRFRVRRAVLRIARIGVVRNEHGRTNLQYLQERVAPPRGSSSLPRAAEWFLIDRMVLSIGRVTFHDYAGSGLAPTMTMYEIGIQEEPFDRVTDRKTIIGLLILKVMSKSALGQVPDLGVDLDEIERSVYQTMQSGAGLLKGTLVGAQEASASSAGDRAR